MRLPLLIAAALLVLAACDSNGSSASQSVRYEVDGPASVAFSTDDGNLQITTSGPWSTDLNASSSTVLALTATSTTSEPVTASIFVDDSLVRKRRGSSVHVEMSSNSSGSSSSSNELEVRGLIEAIDANSVTVLGLTFQISTTTRLLDDDNQSIQLSAFSVGTYVEVEGRPTGDGTYRATKLKFEDDEGGDGGIEVEINGTIGSIDATSFVVNGRRFITNASTRYLDDRNSPISRSDLRVGELVEAEGYARSDGAVDAKKIKRDDD